MRFNFKILSCGVVLLGLAWLVSVKKSVSPDVRLSLKMEFERSPVPVFIITLANSNSRSVLLNLNIDEFEGMLFFRAKTGDVFQLYPKKYLIKLQTGVWIPDEFTLNGKAKVIWRVPMKSLRGSQGRTTSQIELSEARVFAELTELLVTENGQIKEIQLKSEEIAIQTSPVALQAD